MANVEKKKRKLQERINHLENEMRMSLTKKTSDTKEISVGSYQREILKLKTELQKM